jgi:hypothetical protein
MKSNPFLGLAALYKSPETELIHRQLVAWMESTLTWVDQALNDHPPAWPEPEIRKAALFMLDEPLHVLSAPIEAPVAAFLNRRIGRAVEEMESEVVTSGTTVWKLYNHSFVVKTPEIAIGFDLHRGPFESFQIEPGLFDRALGAVAGLFVSHEHGDHADRYAVSRMVELGRPVVAPPRLFEGEAIAGQLITPERHWKVTHDLQLGDVSVTFHAFPGHQGPALINNVYLVALPGGLHVMHTGDQSYGDDFAVWIDRLHEQFRVDVLLPNCWTTDLPRLIRATRPQLVMTGHENELSHSVDHREAYAKTYAHIVDEPTPVVVMAWGERYHFENGQLLEAVAPPVAMGEIQAHLRSFL